MYYLSPIRDPMIGYLPMVSSQFTSLGVAARAMEDRASCAYWRVHADNRRNYIRSFLDRNHRNGCKECRGKNTESGMQIPGYRRSSGTLERVMQRYIPKVTVIGGAFIGLLTLIASLLGTLGGAGGTGLLLTVSIMYRLYEDIASQQVMECTRWWGLSSEKNRLINRTLITRKFIRINQCFLFIPFSLGFVFVIYELI